MAKKIRPRHVVADPYANAIIVEYLIEFLSDEANKTQINSEKKQFTIHTPELNEDTDIVNIAYKIIKQCQYIPEKWLGKVVDALKEIQFRTIHGTNNLNDSDLSSDARISNRLEANLEHLYGGDDDRVSSLEDILSVCMDLQNLELVVYDDPLMSALSRLLSEHAERSDLITFLLLKIFLLLADYDDFHESLSKYRIGTSIMSIIKMELKRVEQMVAANTDISEEEHKSASNRFENTLLLCCEILLRLSDNTSTMTKMLKKNLTGMLLSALPQCCMFPCLLSILKLLVRATEYSEVVTEIDCSKLFLSPILLLVRLISSTCYEIGKYAMKVLYNLSFNYDALCKMVDAEVVPKLIGCRQPIHFGILYHMSSFDEVKFSSKLEPLAKHTVTVFQSYMKNNIPRDCFAFLINMSIRPYFAEEIICLKEALIDRLGRFNDRFAAKLLRNLVVWTRKLQISIETALQSGNFDAISKLTRDPSKFVKPVTLDSDGEYPTYFNNYRSFKFWDGHIENIVLMCTKAVDDNDLLLELLGILNHLTINDMIPSMSWSTICQKYSLFTHLKRCVIPRINKTDIIVEAIILCCQICSHKDGATLFLQSRMINSIMKILDDCDEDTELLLQTILLCETLLPFGDARMELLYNTDLLQVIFDCANEENIHVKSAAIRCLDIIETIDADEGKSSNRFATLVKERKFLLHNRAWIEQRDKKVQGLQHI